MYSIYATSQIQYNYQNSLLPFKKIFYINRLQTKHKYDYKKTQIWKVKFIKKCKTKNIPNLVNL